jgi:hypothetical protein
MGMFVVVFRHAVVIGLLRFVWRISVSHLLTINETQEGSGAELTGLG